MHRTGERLAGAAPVGSNQAHPFRLMTLYQAFFYVRYKPSTLSTRMNYLIFVRRVCTLCDIQCRNKLTLTIVNQTP